MALGNVKSIINFIKAIRPWSFMLSIFPMIIAVLLVYMETGQFNKASLPFLIASVILIHAGANLCNTYYDFEDKVDTELHSSDPGITDKLVTSEQALNGFWLLFVFGMMFFGSGVAVSGRAHLIPYLLFFKGLFFAVTYSAIIKWKRKAMGEVCVYFIFGPAIGLFVYSMLMKGAFSIMTVFLTSPLGLLATSVLLANNIRDSGLSSLNKPIYIFLLSESYLTHNKITNTIILIKSNCFISSGHDLKCNVRTLANQMGLQKSLDLYVLLLLLPYFQVCVVACVLVVTC